MMLSVHYGIPFVTTECAYCNESFTKCAYAQYSPYCDACAYMLRAEREYKTWLYAAPTFWPYGGIR